jgi:chromosome segregation ATPase
VENLKKTIEDKDNVISAMSTDFAFIADNLATVITDKDHIIDLLRKKGEEQEIILDTAEADRLQFELKDTKAKHQQELDSKNLEIVQLRTELDKQMCRQSESVLATSEECIHLRRQLQTVTSEKEQIEHELERLKSRASQLEQLVRTEEKDQKSTELMEQLQIAKNKLTERNNELDKLREAQGAAQDAFDELRQRVEEAESRIGGVFEMEQRLTGTIERLNAEKGEIWNELRQKTTALANVSDALSESQELSSELMEDLEKAKLEVQELKQEGVILRAKNQEITRNTTDRASQLLREANGTILGLNKQLQEKTRECEVFQKLLGETRKELAPLCESVIPQLKSRVNNLAAEKEEILRKVKGLNQFAVYVEQAVGQNSQLADADAFCQALRRLQQELQILDK